MGQFTPVGSPITTWNPTTPPSTPYSGVLPPNQNFAETPYIDEVTPNTGPAGTKVLISGTGFLIPSSLRPAISQVTFGGLPTVFKVISDNLISATAPNPLAGSTKVLVSVSTFGGLQSPTYGEFTYTSLYTIWDSFTAINCTVTDASTDALTVQNTADSIPSNSTGGVQALNADAKTSGRYYYEVTYQSISGGSNGGNALGPPGSAYGDLMIGTLAAAGVLQSFDSAYSQGSLVSLFQLSKTGSYTAGDVIGIAVDLDHRSVWFKIVAGPDAGWDWNGGEFGLGAGSNPASNIFGIALPPEGPIIPFFTFGNNVAATDIIVANFGQNNFSLTNIPAGFTAGWTT